MPENWHAGNAAIDGQDHRGWIVGHFMGDTDDIRTSKDVEIKWGIHPAGDERADWQTDEYRTTVVVLISGQFRLSLSNDDHRLANVGDYVMWGPGTGHTWAAEEDSVVLTIRWPSECSN
jgi:hypothetical protein